MQTFNNLPALVLADKATTEPNQLRGGEARESNNVRQTDASVSDSRGGQNFNGCGARSRLLFAVGLALFLSNSCPSTRESGIRGRALLARWRTSLLY